MRTQEDSVTVSSMGDVIFVKPPRKYILFRLCLCCCPIIITDDVLKVSSDAYNMSCCCCTVRNHPSSITLILISKEDHYKYYYLCSLFQFKIIITIIITLYQTNWSVGRCNSRKTELSISIVDYIWSYSLSNTHIRGWV